jgi:hypothetical protein
MEKLSKSGDFGKDILHQKCRFLTKEKRRKSLICGVLLFLTFGSSGATRKRVLFLNGSISLRFPRK